MPNKEIFSKAEAETRLGEVYRKRTEHPLAEYAKLGAGALTGPEPTIDEARAILKQANDIACRIISLSDRLCGFSPAPDTATTDAVPNGVLNQFRAEMRDTRQAMIFADDALTRIEQELIG